MSQICKEWESLSVKKCDELSALFKQAYENFHFATDSFEFFKSIQLNLRNCHRQIIEAFGDINFVVKVPVLCYDEELKHSSILLHAHFDDFIKTHTIIRTADFTQFAFRCVNENKHERFLLSFLNFRSELSFNVHETALYIWVGTYKFETNGLRQFLKGEEVTLINVDHSLRNIRLKLFAP